MSCEENWGMEKMGVFKMKAMCLSESTLFPFAVHCHNPFQLAVAMKNEEILPSLQIQKRQLIHR
jgi:hypothetical protein